VTNDKNFIGQTMAQQDYKMPQSDKKAIKDAIQEAKDIKNKKKEQKNELQKVNTSGGKEVPLVEKKKSNE